MRSPMRTAWDNISLILLSSPGRGSWSIGDSTYLIEIMKPFTIYRSLEMRILKRKFVTLNLNNKWTVALKSSMCTSSQYFNISIHLHSSMRAVRRDIHSTGQHTSYIYITRTRANTDIAIFSKSSNLITAVLTIMLETQRWVSYFLVGLIAGVPTPLHPYLCRWYIFVGHY